MSGSGIASFLYGGVTRFPLAKAQRLAQQLNDGELTAKGERWTWHVTDIAPYCDQGQYASVEARDESGHTLGRYAE